MFLQEAYIRDLSYFLSFFETFTCPCPILNCIPKKVRLIFPCIDHCGSALNDVLAVNLRLQAQKCAFERTVGQNCKNPPKIRFRKIVKLTLSYLLLQQANAMPGNGNDISLLKLSLQKIYEVASWKLIFGGF
jgi:hypothetical protein